MIVGDFLDYAADHFPGKLAIIFKDKRLTYQQLKERVQRLSAGLISQGVKKGDRVAVLMWNCTELIETYLASIRIGAIFTPVNYRLTRGELEYVLRDADPSLLIIDQKCRDMIDGDMASTGLAGRLYYAGPQMPPGMKPYNDLFPDMPCHDKPVIGIHDPCQLIYTSGTTARPKGVLLSHDNVVWNTVNMLLRRHDRHDDIAIIAGPMFHSAALNSHYTARLSMGATSIVMERFDPQELMSLIPRERVTVVSGSPTLLIILMEHCKPGDYDTSSVTTLTSGADKLPLQVQKAIREYFPNVNGVYDVYGPTECSPCVTTLDACDSLRKVGSVGPPLPFVKVRLLDDAGKDVRAGEIGEIVVQGPNVMLGYYKQPEETAKVLKDGWFYTGDMAWADEEGYLFFSDRKKDVIVSGGENIASREVEEALYKHPDVFRAAVFGVPDEKWGERVIAAIVPKEGAHPVAEEVRAFTKQHLAGYKIPREIMVMDQLPESGTGKVQKNELKKIYKAKNGGK